MFDPCPRCKKLKTRFEMKWHFSLTSQETDTAFRIAKERFGQFDDKKLCFRCYRALLHAEDSLWMGCMLATLIAKMIDAEIPKEEQAKCIGAFLNGYSKAQRP